MSALSAEGIVVLRDCPMLTTQEPLRAQRGPARPPWMCLCLHSLSIGMFKSPEPSWPARTLGRKGGWIVKDPGPAQALENLPGGSGVLAGR